MPGAIASSPTVSCGWLHTRILWFPPREEHPELPSPADLPSPPSCRQTSQRGAHPALSEGIHLHECRIRDCEGQSSQHHCPIGCRRCRALMRPDLPKGATPKGRTIIQFPVGRGHIAAKWPFRHNVGRLVAGTMRRDGSSSAHPNHLWGPSTPD